MFTCSFASSLNFLSVSIHCFTMFNQIQIHNYYTLLAFGGNLLAILSRHPSLNFSQLIPPPVTNNSNFVIDKQLSVTYYIAVTGSGSLAYPSFLA